MLATPPGLARPIPEQRARGGSKASGGTGHGALAHGAPGSGSGLVAVGRLRHAELGKSAPATHGREAGCGAGIGK